MKTISHQISNCSDDRKKKSFFFFKTYLSFQHVTNEEYHHTCINFVLCTPLIPSWYTLTKLRPNIIWWNQNQNKDHFNGQNYFRKQKINTRWIIIVAFQQYVWITFFDYCRIFFKCFSITTWVTGFTMNDKQKKSTNEEELNWFIKIQYK